MEQAEPERAHGVSRRSMGIAAASTVVEWYDFTLYLYFVTVLARVFFGSGPGVFGMNGLGITLAGFAVAYLMRPLGAVALGHFGDRFGRRRAMMASMAVMTCAMLATAALPTRAMAGPIAGWLLMALRCVMAFAVGGEYTGVVAYLTEGAAPARRGFVASLASAASEVGALMAVGVAGLVVWALPAPALDDWGWRVPFVVGALLAGGIWVARAQMEESPEFLALRASGDMRADPLGHALRHERAGIARGFAMSALGSITYYVGITYVPAFLAAVGAVGEGAGLWLSTVAAVVVIAVTPPVGALSDKVGRKPVLLALAGLSAVMPAALFAVMALGGFWPALAGAVLLAALGGGVSAVASAATAEMFPGETRLTGLAIGVTTGTAIFGGLTPWVAQALVGASGAAWAPGAMIAVVALAILPVFVAMPETAPALPAKR